MTIVHIIAGLLAITAGFAALFAAKGGKLHRRGGIVFVGAMIVMAGIGGVMAANYSICLGTAGWGVWHSPDAGQSWTRHRAW